MEAGLKVVVASGNPQFHQLRRGNERFSSGTGLAKRYGAAVVVERLMSGNGRARQKGSSPIAQRAIATPLTCIPAHEFSTTPRPASDLTWYRGRRGNGAATIEAIRRIPGPASRVHVVLGVSNISFGLSQPPKLACSIGGFLHGACSAA